jgi:hypothetical protein
MKTITPIGNGVIQNPNRTRHAEQQSKAEAELRKNGLVRRATLISSGVLQPSDPNGKYTAPTIG